MLPIESNHLFYNDLVEVTELQVGGPQYHKDSAVVPALYHRVKGNQVHENTPQKCLLFFHGGMGIAGSSRDVETLVNRMAEESDTVIINVEYRLAPEHKAPAAIYDGYAALKYVLENS